MTQLAFSLRGTSVLRNGHALLEAVDLEARTGTLILLTGPNGAGKTTLLRVLSGVMRPSGGELTILGRLAPVPRATGRRVRAALDEPAFWPWMTAHGVIRTVADLSGEPAPAADHVLAELGLDAQRFALKRSKRVKHFSQGMRKRLQVACVLALPADLILLDEPTASLDVAGARLVWEALARRLAQGATIVVATHDRARLDHVDGRTVELDAGRVIRDSAPIAERVS